MATTGKAHDEAAIANGTGQGDIVTAEELGTMRYELRGAGAWIVFTRPERRNCLNDDVIAELRLCLARAAADPDVRAVVITGSGGAFCAGADLSFVQSLTGPKEIVARFLQPLTEALREIRELPKPVVAAINGHCVAGGVEMMLVCDLVLAAADATIADGHARHGLLPAIGGAHGLSRALGPHKAKEMLFTADSYTGAELAAMNLVNRAVPADQLGNATAALVATLAARSPSGLARMKQMVNAETDMSWEHSARYELAHAEAHLASGVPAEGLAAFLQRREPTFGPDQ